MVSDPSESDRPTGDRCPQDDPWLTDKMVAALAQLAQARSFAQQRGLDVWDFAVEIRMLDLRPNDLRWLICSGYVEHAEETTQPRRKARAFRPGGSLVFADRSCFILTEAGQSLAERVAAHGQSSNGRAGNGQSGNGHAAPTITDHPIAPHPSTDHRGTLPAPRWDPTRRELWLGDKLIKRFRQPSPNQERILNTFEDDRWPSVIDDPLPSDPEKDPKRRLSHTIHCLNQHHIHNLIRFEGNGTGEGIIWKRVLPAGL